MSSVLTSLQEAAVAGLQAKSYFAPAPILYERQKDFRSALEKAIKSLGGIAIIALTPACTNKAPASPVIHVGAVLVVAVIENVLLNNGAKGTKIGASEWAEQVACALHLRVWVAGKTLVFRDIKLVESEQLLYHVTFDTNATLTPVEEED